MIDTVVYASYREEEASHQRIEYLSKGHITRNRQAKIQVHIVKTARSTSKDLRGEWNENTFKNNS